MPGTRVALAFIPPYDWPAMLAFLAPRAIPGVETVTPDRYARRFAQGTLTVSRAPGRDALDVEISAAGPALIPAVAARLRRLFDLQTDPAPIAAHLARDEDLAWRVAARPGLRVPGAWDGFELAVRAILGQQITVAAASRLAGRLVAHCGTRHPATDGALPGWVFPTPAQVAAAGDLGLALGMPRQRAAAITALARAAATDAALFEPAPEGGGALARLRALPGIGEWTAQYIGMRALRDSDAFPAADIGLLRAMATERGRPTAAALLARAERWRPYRAYAALHLWAAPAQRGAPTTHCS